MPRISGAHHVLGVPHLLSELKDSEGIVLLGSTGYQREEADHGEVKAGKKDQVHGELSEIGVKLSWESQATCHSRHGGGGQMVQVPKAWCDEPEGSEQMLFKASLSRTMHSFADDVAMETTPFRV